MSHISGIDDYQKTPPRQSQLRKQSFHEANKVSEVHVDGAILKTPPRNMKQNGLAHFGKKVIGGKMSAFKSPTPGRGQSASKGCANFVSHQNKVQPSVSGGDNILGLQQQQSHHHLFLNTSPISRSFEKQAADYIQASGGKRLIKNNENSTQREFSSSGNKCVGNGTPSLLMMFGQVSKNNDSQSWLISPACIGRGGGKPSDIAARGLSLLSAQRQLTPIQNSILNPHGVKPSEVRQLFNNTNNSNTILLPWSGKHLKCNESPETHKKSGLFTNGLLSTAGHTGSGFNGIKYGTLQENASSIKLASFLKSAEKQTPSPNQIKGFMFSQSHPGGLISSSKDLEMMVEPQCLHNNHFGVQDSIKLALGDTPPRVGERSINTESRQQCSDMKCSSACSCMIGDAVNINMQQSSQYWRSMVNQVSISQPFSNSIPANYLPPPPQGCYYCCCGQLLEESDIEVDNIMEDNQDQNQIVDELSDENKNQQSFNSTKDAAPSKVPLSISNEPKKRGRPPSLNLRNSNLSKGSSSGNLQKNLRDDGSAPIFQKNAYRETLPTHTETGERIIRRRKRKNRDQMDLLAVEFDKNPDWSKERLFELSELTGLSEAQIYKWGWDQRRKGVTGEVDTPMQPPAVSDTFNKFKDNKREIKHQRKEQENKLQVSSKDNDNNIEACKIRLDFNKPSAKPQEFIMPKIQTSDTALIAQPNHQVPQDIESQVEKRVTRQQGPAPTIIQQEPAAATTTRVLRSRSSAIPKSR